ncbi:MAG TPA: SOS response-associated peptidase [Abditibacteriaceae bacterium]|nr:SOS response-associated peptidase [Abditibacteriaceae bacterium]
MCGRYTLGSSTDEVAARFDLQRVLFETAPRYNIAPSQSIAVVMHDHENGGRRLEGFKWGLVPFWANDPLVGQRLINARAETVAQKPAFKYAFARRRCIIPASGFYEWKRVGDERLPFYIRPADGVLFGFAGIWEEWQSPTGAPLRTCAIITTAANQLIEPVCSRMPVILRPEDEAAWLSNSTHHVPELMQMLQPFSARGMRIFPVSQRVNSPYFDEPACIEPVPHAAAAPSLFDNQMQGRALRPKRRLVRRDFVAPGGQIFFKTRSFTRDDLTRWHPVVDVEAGHVFCDCPDFRYRHAPHEPNVLTPQHWCKHLARAVTNCRRHGEIDYAHLGAQAV